MEWNLCLHRGLIAIINNVSVVAPYITLYEVPQVDLNLILVIT